MSAIKKIFTRVPKNPESPDPSPSSAAKTTTSASARDRDADRPASPSISTALSAMQRGSQKSPTRRMEGLRARFSTDDAAQLPPMTYSETPVGLPVPMNEQPNERVLMHRLMSSLQVSSSSPSPPPPPHTLPAANNVEQTSLTNTFIASSVWLQQLLYHNVNFSLLWFIMTVGSTYFKGVMYGKAHDEIRTICIVLWMVAEPIRLYLGYAGNLQEKVPLLVVFMAVTTFPCLPVTGYLFMAQKAVEPFDKAVNTVMLALLLTELGTGAHAIRQLVRSQDQKFYLQDYEQQRAELYTHTRAAAGGGARSYA